MIKTRVSVAGIVIHTPSVPKNFGKMYRNERTMTNPLRIVSTVDILGFSIA
jgi:hypothetical protein